MQEIISKRFENCRLALNRDKTKVVYCKDLNRRQTSFQTSFDYLGFTFRPRVARSSITQKLFTTFTPAISKKARMKIHETVKSWKLSSKLMMSIGQLASYINPAIMGWVNYYARFNKTEFRRVTQYLNEVLARWMRRKYKRLHHDFGAAKVALAKTAKKLPNLFAHWTYGYRPYLKLVN